MKSLDDIISSRYSERDFSQDEILDSEVDVLLNAALTVATPSGGFPLKYYIFKSADSRNQLKSYLEKGKDHLIEKYKIEENFKKIRNTVNYYYRFAEKLFNAPLIVAVATSPDGGFSSRLSSLGVHEGDYISRLSYSITAGLSLQNLMLKCSELGLASCIMTAPLTILGESISDFCESGYEIESFVAIGHPADTKNIQPVQRGIYSEL